MSLARMVVGLDDRRRGSFRRVLSSMFLWRLWRIMLVTRGHCCTMLQIQALQFSWESPTCNPYGDWKFTFYRYGQTNQTANDTLTIAYFLLPTIPTGEGLCLFFLLHWGTLPSLFLLHHLLLSFLLVTSVDDVAKLIDNEVVTSCMQACTPSLEVCIAYLETNSKEHWKKNESYEDKIEKG